MKWARWQDRWVMVGRREFVKQQETLSVVYESVVLGFVVSNVMFLLREPLLSLRCMWNSGRKTNKDLRVPQNTEYLFILYTHAHWWMGRSFGGWVGGLHYFVCFSTWFPPTFSPSAFTDLLHQILTRNQICMKTNSEAIVFHISYSS